jgi:hypothetical protein
MAGISVSCTTRRFGARTLLAVLVVAVSGTATALPQKGKQPWDSLPYDSALVKLRDYGLTASLTAKRVTANHDLAYQTGRRDDTVLLCWEYQEHIIPNLLGLTVNAARETLAAAHFTTGRLDQPWPVLNRRQFLRLLASGDTTKRIRSQQPKALSRVSGLPVVHLYFDARRERFPYLLVGGACIVVLVVLAIALHLSGPRSDSHPLPTLDMPGSVSIPPAAACVPSGDVPVTEPDEEHVQPEAACAAPTPAAGTSNAATPPEPSDGVPAMQFRYLSHTLAELDESNRALEQRLGATTAALESHLRDTALRAATALPEGRREMGPAVAPKAGERVHDLAARVRGLTGRVEDLEDGIRDVKGKLRKLDASLTAQGRHRGASLFDAPDSNDAPSEAEPDRGPLGWLSGDPQHLRILAWLANRRRDKAGPFPVAGATRVAVEMEGDPVMLHECADGGLFLVRLNHDETYWYLYPDPKHAGEAWFKRCFDRTATDKTGRELERAMKPAQCRFLGRDWGVVEKGVLIVKGA